MANTVTISEISNSNKKLPVGVFLGILAALAGLLIFIWPIHYIIIGILVSTVAGILIAKPKLSYTLAIFTLPFSFLSEKVMNLPIVVLPMDVLIFFAFVGVLLQMFFKSEKVNLSSPLGKWMVILAILFIIDGATSLNFWRGILAGAKFIEAIIFGYLSIYFIRTGKMSVKSILKVIIFTALFQAGLGLLQSFTGQFGANFWSDRGYLGYLGLGSSYVCHAIGTMQHFNQFGSLMTGLFAFLLPVYWFTDKKDLPFGKYVPWVIFFAVVCSYSRDSLIALLVVGFIFLSQIMKPSKFIWTSIILGTGLFIVGSVLGHSDYVSTLNSRDNVWQIHMAAITSSFRSLWFGTGLNSDIETIRMYLPQNIPAHLYDYTHAHSLYLSKLEELGIVGSGIFFTFVVFVIQQAYRFSKKITGIAKPLNLGLALYLISVLVGGLFDNTYHESFFICLFMLLIGVTYAHNCKISAKA